MEDLNINNVDNNFVILRNKKAEITTAINVGLKASVMKIVHAIKAEQINNNISYKQARKTIKEQVMRSLYKEVVNNKGVTTQKLICDANTLRSFNIAFTIIFRDIIGIETLELSTSQIETASTYFSKAECDKLLECETEDELKEEFKAIVSEYKKVSSVKVLDTSMKKVSGK